MKRLDNPSLDRLILEHLANLYHIKEKREGIHLSTLVYCLTRSFFDQVAPIEPTDEEVMLFSLGYGLQDVLTPADTETPTYELDGIIFRPDFVMKLAGDQHCELKTTRMSSKRADFPQTWVEYIMGGCYIRGVQSYELSVLYMLGNYAPPFPTIHSETLIFEEDELEINWGYLLSRKAIYEDALAENLAPVPFTYCKSWECSKCRYRLQCTAIDMVGVSGGEPG